MIDGIDLDGKEWNYYVDPNSIDLKIKVVVNINFVVDKLKLSSELSEKYQEAIKKQFDRTLRLSSGNFVSGELTFNKFSSNSKQVVPQLVFFGEKPKNSNVTGKAWVKAGQTLNFGSFVNVYGVDGKLKTPEKIGEDALHEIFHTLMLDHPFARVQTNDTYLFQVGKNSYKTIKETDKNIYYNIMNYNFIKIDDLKLGDLWKEKKAELITKQQILYILKQIDGQKAGEGMENKSEYNDYWDAANWPGTPVSTKPSK